PPFNALRGELEGVNDPAEIYLALSLRLTFWHSTLTRRLVPPRHHLSQREVSAGFPVRLQKFTARPGKFPVPLRGKFSAKGQFASHSLGRSGAAKRGFKRIPDKFPAFIPGNLSFRLRGPHRMLTLRRTALHGFAVRAEARLAAES